MTLKTNRFWRRFRVEVGLLCIVLVVPSISSAQQRQKRPVPPPQSNRPTLDPFLNPASGPISLAKLLDLVQRVREDIETEGRILRAIEARGVDFSMTTSNAQAVASAGGSTNLIELLRRKAPAPPPPPSPPPPPPGALTVRCEPAECDIVVRGRPIVRTNNGTTRITELEPGEIVVEILKSGYLHKQRTVVIKSGADDSLSVALEPDASTQADLGARLFKAMVAAAGEASHKDLAVLSATGSATLFDSSGSGTEWNLIVTLRPNQATFEAKNSAGGLKLECRGETCQSQTGGKLFAKRLSREQTQILETNLRQFRTYQFVAQLDRMVSGGMQATAKTANIPGLGEQQLRLENKNEVYNILLDAQLLPAFVTFESKMGLGSGLAVSFTDYAVVGTSRYPRITEIKFPGGKQGIRVRFDQFGPASGGK